MFCTLSTCQFRASSASRFRPGSIPVLSFGSRSKLQTFHRRFTDAERAGLSIRRIWFTMGLRAEPARLWGIWGQCAQAAHNGGNPGACAPASFPAYQESIRKVSGKPTAKTCHGRQYDSPFRAVNVTKGRLWPILGKPFSAGHSLTKLSRASSIGPCDFRAMSLSLFCTLGMRTVGTVVSGSEPPPRPAVDAWSDLSRPRICTPLNSLFTHAVTNSEMSRRLPRAASLSLSATSSSRVSCNLTFDGLAGLPVCRLAMRTADPSSRFVAEHASMRTGQQAIRLIGWHVRRSA